MKENELAPEQVVVPLVASNATDGLGQMELPIAEATRVLKGRAAIDAASLSRVAGWSEKF